MLRAWIIINLVDGRRFKYVRDVVTDNGVNTEYYSYGDSTGDTLLYQGGDSGKILYDFQEVSAFYTAASSFNDYLQFPENTGDTTYITRTNWGETISMQPGSSGDSNIIPLIRSSLSVNAIVSINIEEEWIPPSNVTIPALP